MTEITISNQSHTSYRKYKPIQYNTIQILVIHGDRFINGDEYSNERRFERALILKIIHARNKVLFFFFTWTQNNQALVTYLQKS
jgi:hypothetical protein